MHISNLHPHPPIGWRPGIHSLILHLEKQSKLELAKPIYLKNLDGKNSFALIVLDAKYAYELYIWTKIKLYMNIRENNHANQACPKAM